MVPNGNFQAIGESKTAGNFEQNNDTQNQLVETGIMISWHYPRIMLYSSLNNPQLRIYKHLSQATVEAFNGLNSGQIWNKLLSYLFAGVLRRELDCLSFCE